MPHYRCNGLVLACNVTLPCLGVAAGTPVDCTLTFAPAGLPADVPPSHADTTPGFLERLWRDADGWSHVSYVDPLNGARLDFALSPDGREVRIGRDESVLVADIIPVLLGVIMGMLLSLHGLPALHANTVLVERRAVLIVGVSGAGKSSCTAALVAAGCPLLADDIATLLPGQVTKIAHGYPYLRLWPDTARALGEGWQGLSGLFIRDEVVGDKRYRDLSRSPGLFAGADHALGAICLLERRDAALTEPRLVRLSQREALPLLLQQLFLRGDRVAARARWLPRLAELAALTPVFRLTLPDGLERLAATGAALRRQLTEQLRA